MNKKSAIEILFRALIRVTNFNPTDDLKNPRIEFVEPLDVAYIDEWKTWKKIEHTNGDWTKVPDSAIKMPMTSTVPHLQDLFSSKRHLIMINDAGYNHDIRSRAEEYAELFGLNEDAVRESDTENVFFHQHPKLKQPFWYANWQPIYKFDSHDRGITFKDLAIGLSQIKSGKKDDNYELLSSVHISQPNFDTIQINVDFDHGS
jgi:hypothetical protein